MNIFEDIKRIDPDGQEYWSSRDLAKVLEFVNYQYFDAIISKAKNACQDSGYTVSYHLVDTDDMIFLGKGAKREIKSIFLSRYACCLIELVLYAVPPDRISLKFRQK